MYAIYLQCGLLTICWDHQHRVAAAYQNNLFTLGDKGEQRKSHHAPV